jgi:hypothetical protein
MSKVHTGGNAAEGISSAAISENKVRVMMPETVLSEDCQETNYEV